MSAEKFKVQAIIRQPNQREARADLAAVFLMFIQADPPGDFQRIGNTIGILKIEAETGVLETRMDRDLAVVLDRPEVCPNIESSRGCVVVFPGEAGG